MTPDSNARTRSGNRECTKWKQRSSMLDKKDRSFRSLLLGLHQMACFDSISLISTSSMRV